MMSDHQAFSTSVLFPYSPILVPGPPPLLQSPPPLLIQPPPPLIIPLPPYLFHYTNEHGMKSMWEQQFIRKSNPARQNNTAYYGEGVYLTGIPPDAPDNVLLWNNWNSDGDGSTSPNLWNGSKAAKLQYCFVIPACSLYPWALFKMSEKNGRDIWVYRGGITLGDRDVLLIRRW